MQLHHKRILGSVDIKKESFIPHKDNTLNYLNRSKTRARHFNQLCKQSSNNSNEHKNPE